MGNASLFALGEYSNELEIVDVDYCNVTDVGLHFLIESCSLLKLIHFEETDVTESFPQRSIFSTGNFKYTNDIFRFMMKI